MKRRFQQLDVFTAVALKGNPLAVVLDSAGLSSADMQRFTDWTNLSEVTFLLPATTAAADYRVRIFCPGRELPFAGHPTLGSCQAWLNAGGVPQADVTLQECGAGLVRIRRSAGRLAFAAPPLLRSGPLAADERDHIVAGLGIKATDVLGAAWCDNGPHWRALLLRDAALVLALRPDAHLLRGLEVGVIGPHPAGSECAFEVRAFFPGAGGGVTEDPVTGSLNAALAQWLIGAGLAPPQYVAAQGTAMGRAGRVHIEQVDADVWVGGDVTACIEGLVDIGERAG